MQLPALFLIRPHIANDEVSQSSVLSRRPLVLSSQFPREAAISILLVFISVFLVALGTEACLRFAAMVVQPGGMTLKTCLWFMGYCLANILFLAHCLLYFTFRETIEMQDNAIHIRQTLFGYSRDINIPLSEILCAHLGESFLGAHRLEVLSMDATFQRQTFHFGMCLSREHLEVLCAELKVRSLHAL